MKGLHALLAGGEAVDRDRDEQVQHVAEALAVLLEEIGPEPEWQQRAACRGQTKVMFPERGQDIRPAKALCASCPVHAECEAWGAAAGSAQGGFVAGRGKRSRRGQKRVVTVDSTLVGDVPANDAPPNPDGTCLCCRRVGFGAFRIKAGFCAACYQAWRRYKAEGHVLDRAAFIAERRLQLVR
ncbi:WhiB family transcriptional regulator [Dermatobacter hominis]|uniref:WhiB family transcriptional regulator n=1 Tax=Dermatobacter hominis TaxID=2884263 RepID=UPI001D0FDD03|nr:WhiB family transcriptional regulator [Dermatobacter hominis]UDY35529.1 WhiB family transcriptional regulator [Dermatobacter hominis]